MIDPRGIEPFVRRYFELRGGGLDEDGNGIFLVSVPESLRPAFQGALTLRITFDPAIAASAPNVELAVPGSYLMDRILEDAVHTGFHSAIRVEKGQDAPEAAVARTIRPRNATVTVETVKTSPAVCVLFNFRVRLTTDERVDRVESVLIDTRSGTERQTASVLFEQGTSGLTELGFDVPDLDETYRAACRALEDRIEANVRVFQDQARKLYEDERRRIEEYFTRSIQELAEAKAGHAQDEVRSLELERSRRLEEALEKYRFVGEVELCNVRTVLLDVTEGTLVVSHRSARRVVPFEFDGVGNGLEPIPCEVCGTRTVEPVLCFGGHLTGVECVRGCAFCDRMHCLQCGSLGTGITTCTTCGRTVCPDHVYGDALSRRPHCPDHIHSCGICSRTVGPEYVRICRTCEQAYCALCITEPSEQCLTCRNLVSATADQPSVATVRGTDPSLARVSKWRLGSNRRYTIVVAKGIVWSQLFVLDRAGTILVRKKVLGA